MLLRHARDRLDLLAAEVAGAADAPRAVVHLALCGLRRGEQVARRLPLRVGGDGDPQRRAEQPGDRLLSLTPQGRALPDAVLPATLKAQERILAPLPARERERFMDMLRTLVRADNESSRAPGEAA